MQDFLESCRAPTLLADLEDDYQLPDDDENDDENEDDEDYEEVLVSVNSLFWMKVNPIVKYCNHGALKIDSNVGNFYREI